MDSIENEVLETKDSFVESLKRRIQGASSRGELSELSDSIDKLRLDCKIGIEIYRELQSTLESHPKFMRSPGVDLLYK